MGIMCRVYGGGHSYGDQLEKKMAHEMETEFLLRLTRVIN